MKKREIAIIAVIIIAAFATFAGYYLTRQSTPDYRVRIRRDDRVLKEMSLDTDTVTTITQDGQSNTITIQDGQVSVTAANCDNQICVHTAPISTPGQTIACLPHRLLIEIIPEDTP